MPQSRLVAALALLLVDAVPLDARELKPKLGPHAIAIQQSHEYFRSNAAPDYWALSPYYVGQVSNSACSLAAITMLVNAMRGMPAYADERFVTQASLRDRVATGNGRAERTRMGAASPGTPLRNTWPRASQPTAWMRISRPSSHRIIQRRRSNGSARCWPRNERSDRDIVLIYYNQGVVTGDWDGPHISPLAAYDAERRRVLVLDVDRQWYGPYWTSDEKLLEAMLRPAPARLGCSPGRPAVSCA